MPLRRRIAASIILVCGLAVATSAAAAERPERPARPSLDVGEVLGAAAGSFARATAPRPFVFPADHGPHPDFRSEWWYLTAHFETPDGPVGVQFTLFRQGLAPGLAAADAASAWRTRQIYMAHLAVSDPQAGQQAAERFARGAVDLAGVTASPFRAWLEDWSLQGDGVGLWPLQLQASTRDTATPIKVQLQAVNTRPLVLQGEAGLSRKSATPGNASYYYSYTRLRVTGRITVGEHSHEVDGLGWLDREWSSSALEPDQAGWDWLALHLDDGRDLMIYRMRGLDGSVGDASEGVLVDADGGTTRLPREAWTLQPVKFWTSEDGSRWPVAFDLAVPDHGIAGQVAAVRNDQLNRLSVRYWEGVVELDGALPGQGYLETTGYGAISDNTP